MSSILDPRREMGPPSITVTVKVNGAGTSSSSGVPVTSDPLNAEPSWVGALAASQEYRMDSRYMAFWEYVERIARDVKSTFRDDEVPPPVAAYFKRLDGKV